MTTKSEILSALERSRGEFVSGAELAQMLHISRTAVWKAIKQLEQEGHGIETLAGRGYRLCEQSDLLSSEGISACLPPELENTPVYVLKTVDSTNTYLKRLALEGAAHGTLVLAEEQTAGRGRRGNSFFSPGNTGLYMSLLLRPESLDCDTQMMTVRVAVAVCKALESMTSVKPRIKWVNDIYADGRKLCGILSEAVADLESGSVESIVVGIGLNCTTTQDAFPPELRGIAGSLGGHICRNELAAKIVEGIMRELRCDEQEVIAAYRLRSLMTGKAVRFLREGELLEGVAEGIADNGNLLVAMADGSELVLHSGEVSVKGLGEWK